MSRYQPHAWRRTVLKILAKLPPKQGHALFLHWMLRLPKRDYPSLSDVAAKAGVVVSVIYRLLRKAMPQERQRLILEQSAGVPALSWRLLKKRKASRQKGIRNRLQQAQFVSLQNTYCGSLYIEREVADKKRGGFRCVCVCACGRKFWRSRDSVRGSLRMGCNSTCRSCRGRSSSNSR